MPRFRFFFLIPFSALLFVACSAPAHRPDAPSPAVSNLTTNGRILPIGIDADVPSFGWTLTSRKRGAAQSAYRIRIFTTPSDAAIWDSGRVESDRQVDVAPPSPLPLAAATRYHWQVKIWEEHGAESDWSAPAWFETGLLAPADWAGAEWIARPAAVPGAPLPLLRTAFTVGDKEIRSARLYASARGLYQLSLNGQKVGDQFLAPGWTDYAQRLQSQTYDVTSLLRPGANAFGTALADGWYRGKVGLGWHGVYGDTLSLIARLRITYADGSTAWFDTGPSWTCADGPWLSADLQNGETYDARRAPARWDTASFNAAGWTPVAVVAPPAVARLVPQPDEPVRATEILTALTRTTPAPGEHVYDLGQNMVGVARVRLRGKAGQTVRLRHAEELYRKGDRIGRLYTDNLRGAKATDTYTFAHDGVVTYQPTFTQHGFRYVEITGLDSPPEPADVQGVVLGSDLPNIGDLETSNALINQLVRNVRWGQRGNFVSIPTDTPARDERLGWTGDISVFAPTASTYQDTRAFLSKWMTDVRDTQRANGNIPAVVPQPRREFDETGVGWSDAVITVPHAVWRATGDARIVRQNWDAMLRFYRFVRESATHDGDLLEQGRSSWFSGDWLNLEGVDRLKEHVVIATAYFAENTRMMAELAAALGDEKTAADCASLLPKIRAAFVAAYRRPDGSLHMGTQTVYAMALGMDLIADPAQRELTARRFVEKLAADNYHLKTGFLGTPWLLPALTRIGRDDLALRLLLNEDYPSWGFEIRMGATTMWERWNTIRADGEFGPVDMNSFNHYAYGAVADWMFRHLGGLQPVEPGYRRARIAPLIGQGGLTHAKGTLRTPYGPLGSAWRLADDTLTFTVEIPATPRPRSSFPPPPPTRCAKTARAPRSPPKACADTSSKTVASSSRSPPASIVSPARAHPPPADRRPSPVDLFQMLAEERGELIEGDHLHAVVEIHVPRARDDE